MPTLIDGYNLMHAVGIVGNDAGGDRGVGPGSLQRSRLALLNFLAESLEPDEVPRTTIVFDAKDPPYGLPRTTKHRGLTVHFASQYEDADTLIEELIRTASAPRSLTVVSSDHRLHRAARRRKAVPVDSDVWYAGVVSRRRQRRATSAAAPARPPVPLLEEDVNYWIRRFGGESELARFMADELRGNDPQDDPRPEEPSAGDGKTADEKPTFDEIGNPFPPGYAEDLLDDDTFRTD